MIGVAIDEAGLEAIWADWEALWQRVPGAWPFTSPAWLRPWWQAFGTGRPLVAFRRGPLGLSALLPLYRLGDKLLPMGVGISDYFDVLLAPEAPAGTTETLLAAALQAGGAPRCDLPELPPHSHLLRATAPAGWYDDVWHSSPCPVLSLIPEPAIPKGMRRDLRQARHRADRAGRWGIERANEATLSRLLDTLVTLHTQRWEARGEPGVFADARVYAFQHAAASRLLRSGMLRLEALRLRGSVVAVNYALLAPERIGFYLTCFDRSAAFESPGTILLGHMLDEASREGRSEAHFLRGKEAYKLAWGGTERRNTGRSFIRA